VHVSRVPKPAKADQASLSGPLPLKSQPSIALRNYHRMLLSIWSKIRDSRPMGLTLRQTQHIIIIIIKLPN
jgi:hypothetical protein